MCHGDRVTHCWLTDEDADDAFDVGAMWWRHHERSEHDTDPRPMPHLAVITPAGLACLHCPATDPPHGYWTVTGSPPNVSVEPSLDIGRAGEPRHWHGFLTQGALTP